MDILKYLSDPLFPLFLFAVIVVVSTPIIWISSCKKITGTFNVPTLLLNRKYWALSILNWQYRLKKGEGVSTRDFIIWFNVHYLSKAPTRIGTLERVYEICAEDVSDIRKRILSPLFF